MRQLIRLGIWGMNVIYSVHKLFPVKRQIVFISRQSDSASLDFRLLLEELEKEHKDIRVVELYRMIPGSLFGKIRYAFHIIGPQMHALATSKVAVLDGYSIAVSVLRHKKSLKVIQMWHAMGSLKRFGYAAVGKGEGSSKKIADAFCMHRNYDYIFASGRACIPALSEAFGNPEEKFVVMSLPRTDLLTDDRYMSRTREKILSAYPELAEKKTILYAPTFRKSSEMKSAVEEFLRAVDHEKFHVIMKLHPLMKEKIEPGRALSCDEFTSLELLAVSDCVVTDYSAFVYEAAVAGKPVFAYAFDLDHYKETRGFFTDYEREMPGPVCRNCKELIRLLESGKYDGARVRDFACRYVEHQSGCTQRFANFIDTLYNDDDQ